MTYMYVVLHMVCRCSRTCCRGAPVRQHLLLACRPPAPLSYRDTTAGHAGMQQLNGSGWHDAVGSKRKLSSLEDLSFADPAVHGTITVSAEIAPLLSTKPFQRIRRLKQLGICNLVRFRARLSRQLTARTGMLVRLRS